jgi:hypothetical protein
MWLLLAGALAGCGGRSLSATDTSSDGAGCAVIGHRLSEIRLLSGGEALFAENGGVIADSTSLYYGARATTAGNAADDLDLFKVDARTDAQAQLTADDLETVLLGARQGAVLFAERARGVHYTTPWRLRLRRGDESADLGDQALRYLAHYDLYSEPERQLLDGAGAAWATEQAVLAYDGASVSTVAAAKLATSPFIAGGTIVWSAHDGKDYEVYRARGGAVETLTDNTIEDHDPILVGDEVLWRCGAEICRARGGGRDVLDTGECGSPAAGGGSAAWGCKGHVARYTPGQPLVTIARPAASPVAVRVDGTRLAWVEPDDTVESFPGQGRLFFSDGASPLEVARVGLPCLHCGAYWPPLRVSLRGEVLAWSYAVTGSPTQPEYGNSLGYVRVIAETACR